MQLIIDNTRTSGNFFDNILNDNMLVSVYNINDKNLNDIINIIKDTDNFLFINNNDYNDYNHYNKYDYINNNTINDYINSEYENLYINFNNMFKLSESQYKQYIDFYNEHKKCLIDQKTGRHNFGTIGGGIVQEYKIKKIEDKTFIYNIYVKCLQCNNVKELITTDNINITDDFKKSYELKHKFNSKFDKVEFYRFMEIYNEYKNEDLTVGFINTGLGNIINVKINDFIYDITNIDAW